jgi:hypothetical protein
MIIILAIYTENILLVVIYFAIFLLFESALKTPFFQITEKRSFAGKM